MKLYIMYHAISSMFSISFSIEVYSCSMNKNIQNEINYMATQNTAANTTAGQTNHAIF